MITTQECDTSVASTISASAEVGHDNLAWSECDDEPYCLDYADEPEDQDGDDEPSSRWKWVLAIGAWAAGAAALAVVVGMAFVAFTPQHPSTPSQPSTVTPIGVPILPIDGEPPRNT